MSAVFQRTKRFTAELAENAEPFFRFLRAGALHGEAL